MKKIYLIPIIIIILVATIATASYIIRNDEGKVWEGHIEDFLDTKPTQNDKTNITCQYCGYTDTYYNHTEVCGRWWTEQDCVIATAHGTIKQINYPIPLEGAEGVDTTRFTCEDKDGDHTASFFIEGDITNEFERGDNIILTVTYNQWTSADGFTWDWMHSNVGEHPQGQKTIVLYSGYSLILPDTCIELSDVDWL
jgi:predicted nucleic-acid-binding Zn-ribbon protein